jgi:aryl-alcohol dehydrogenase-like predicted oxidoreductase
MFRLCREEGINFFDTADVYNGGRSEEILGKLMSGCRDEIVLDSKVFFPIAKNEASGGLSRRHIMLAVEASLQRLRTDRLDLYFLHMFDPRTPMEETIRTLEDLLHQGEDLVSRGQQLGGLANRQGPGNFGPARMGAFRLHSASVQFGETPG